MKWNFVLAALAVASTCAMTASAQQQPAAQGGEGVAAIVNDEVISTYDVRQRATLLLSGAGIDPTAEAMDRARLQALRDLVDERLQLQEAKERKINVDANDVDRALTDIARQNKLSLDGMRGQLAASGVGMQTLRKQIEADIAWRRLVGGRFGTRVRISDAQINETLARIKASAAKPQYLVSEILLTQDAAPDAAQLDEIAGRLLEAIRGGAPFPAVARQFSQAASSAAGGDLGWLSQGELRAELLTIVEQLTPGQVSRPVKTQSGIYIIALRDKREGVDPASVTKVSLKQAAAPAGAQAALGRATERLTSCDGLDAALKGVTGAEVSDLGEVMLSELSEDIRQRVEGVPAGKASSVAVNGDKATALVVCTRSATGEGLPSRDEIENRLYEQELAMLAQRYLRNLRRDSTIITR